MGDIKLFHIAGAEANELVGSSARLERPLQRLIEQHLYTLLRIRYLATEHSTGKTHGGRIDTLGLDENNCPVIIEYKRSSNENVINQGLYYLDWLLDHKAEFKLLVMDILGKEHSNEIDWTAPRLLCIASDFTKFDSYAVQQISKNIELIKYRHFENGLFMLEQVNSIPSSSTKPAAETTGDSDGTKANESLVKVEESIKSTSAGRTFEEQWSVGTPELHERFDNIRQYIHSLGDVVEKPLKYWVAFRRLRNFASIWLTAKSGEIVINLNLEPVDVKLESGFIRDVGTVGHWGSGQIELRVKTDEQIEKAQQLLLKSYERA